VDVILGVIVLLGVGIPVGVVGAWFVSGGGMGLAPAFQPAPSLDWPTGVQEDDDFHWTWSSSDDAEHPQGHTTPEATADDEPAIEELEPGQGPRPHPVRRAEIRSA
jgi:hypothetical protein